MKKAWILLLAAALFLTGCGQRADKHPEWDGAWTRFGDLLAAETPEDFSPGEYNDTLSLGGIWYATWHCGEERAVSNAEGEEAAAYDGQIYFLVKECESPAEAQANVKAWLEQEAQNYGTGESRDITAAGQRFSFGLLLSASGENPYSHGASAFGVRGPLAISAELVCKEGFAGDPEAILTAFLSGIHYGE